MKREYGSAMQCAKADCEKTQLVLGSGRGHPIGVAVDAANVYWADEAGLQRCAIGGCGNSPTVLATQGDQAVVLDATYAYFTGSNGWVGRVAR